MSNALMASHPRHVFLKHTIDFLALDRRYKLIAETRSTGSLMLEDSLDAFIKTGAYISISHTFKLRV